MSKLTDTNIQQFLEDFEANSEIIMLEEGKEKNELEKIAEARGMKIKNSGFVYIQDNLCFHRDSKFERSYPSEERTT